MKQYFILLSVAFFLGNAQAHIDDHKNLRHWELATPDPDRIFLNFYGDPAATRAVTWRTSKDKNRKAYAEIAKATDGPAFINNSTRLKAKTETLRLDAYYKNEQDDVSYHSVIFKDLEPETLYAYRVGDGEEYWSEWIQFTTASRQAKPFKFVYFGDAQNEVLSHWSRTIRMAYQIAPNASFALHAGDLINRASADAEWGEWFKAGGFLHSQWSGIPVIGNHEYDKRKKGEKHKPLSIQWRPQFTLPIIKDMPKQLHETVYSVEYQGMQVIVLNSNQMIKEQTPYLKAELEKTGFRWRVVTFHHSMFSPRRGITKDSEEMEFEWRPLFEKHNVDLVLQGHDHTYTRSQSPIREGDKLIDNTFQTMYVTTVSGPKQYAIKDENLKDFLKKGIQPIRNGEQTQFFQVISVEDDLLTYEAYTSTGKLYDAAKITKDFKTGKKSIIQSIPPVRENTFENTPGTENSHE